MVQQGSSSSSQDSDKNDPNSSLEDTVSQRYERYCKSRQNSQ